MRKSVPIALLVVFVFVLIAFAPELEPEQAVPDFVFNKPAKVISIVDGDTFEVRWKNGYRVDVRPASVGAPELYNGSPQCYALEAAAWTAKYLLSHWVWLSKLEIEDVLWSGDRLLCKVYLDSKRTANFGKMMISQGYAKAMERYPRGKILQPWEDEAKKAKRGLWGACEDP